MKQTGKPNSGATAGAAAPAAINIGDLALYKSDDSGLAEQAAQAETPQDPPVRPYVVDLPHFKHINRIPIIDVAKKIGWEVEVEKIAKKIVEKIVCPRSSEHKPGKSPYLKFWRRIIKLSASPVTLTRRACWTWFWISGHSRRWPMRLNTLPATTLIFPGNRKQAT